MPAPPAPAGPPVRRPHPALIGGGVLVVALGFGLPRLLTPDAPGPAAPDPAAAPDGPGPGAALARMAVAVLVAGGLCAAAARYAGRRAAGAAGPMTPTASLRLDGRCVLHYVRVGDRRLLVGTDPGGVKALVELPRAALVPDADEPEPEPAVTATSAGGATVLFARVLAGAGRNGGGS